MLDEGYIKFQAEWTKAPVLAREQWQDLAQARQRLYEHNFIGAYPDGIGFGNISQRIEASDRFLITGSATGNFPELSGQHFSRVGTIDLTKNQLSCTGPIIASSESMSHAVIYQSLPWVSAVAHGHDLALWEKLLWTIPTTDASAPYGSPEMAYSIIDLIQNSELSELGVFVMAGHKEGIFSFGKTLGEAVQKMLQLRNQ